jgi:hypothetical protein
MPSPRWPTTWQADHRSTECRQLASRQVARQAARLLVLRSSYDRQMSDLKLFRIHGDRATEVTGAAMALEKPLQTLIERNMETLFGARRDHDPAPPAALFPC